MLARVWIITAAILLPSAVVAQDAFSTNPLAPIQLAQADAAIDDDVDDDGDEEEDEEEDDGLDFLDDDIEEVRNTQVAAPALSEEVSSVSRSAQPLARTPAAIYVITNEMIKRSGARQLPDVLRLVPGLNVAQYESSGWAVSARGDQGQFANKMLVQIDGRAVYSPIFAGTYWDVNRVLLEDVERIEVIRGPGGTVWGANAVNGVINIVTKSSEDTHGAYAQVGGGSHERAIADARVGGVTNSGVNYRAYVTHNDTGPGVGPGGIDYDAWQTVKSGFRTDWKPNCSDTLTFQGDYLNGNIGNLDQVASAPADTSTYDGNLLGRYTHEFDEDSSFAVQTYWGRFSRRQKNVADQTVSHVFTDIIDLDIQYNFKPGCYHDVVCGVGYRNNKLTLDWENSSNSTNPPTQHYETVGLFAQDTMTMVEDRFYVTLGCKVEHNDFTGVEYQPSARAVFTPNEHQSIWMSVSRAVRVPSVIDRNLTYTVVPGVYSITGDMNANAEVLFAYEAGMRAQPVDWFYWDFAAYYNDYSQLIYTIPTGVALNEQILNGGTGWSWGAELWATVEMNECWKLRSGYTFLNENRQLPGQTPGEGWFTLAPNTAPRNQYYLISSHNLNSCSDLDLIWRFNDSTQNGAHAVPSYLEMDIRYAYRPWSDVELAVVGRNLFDNSHPELSSNAFPSTEVRREVFGSVSFTY